MKRVCLFLAEGYEEVEALTPVDLLRRAGAEVLVMSVTGEKTVKGSHGICVEADLLFDEEEAGKSDLIVFPGGMPGTLNLKACAPLMELMDTFYQDGKRIAAICAAPSILGEKGLLKGRTACCYPGFEEKLKGAEVTMAPVVTDGMITTGRGVGAAVDFGLELIRLLYGEEKSEEIAVSIVKNTGNM